MPKILKSKKMQELLERGKRKAKRSHPPSDGMMFNLLHERSNNGWQYQVDWIYDSRFWTEPWIEVFAFAPNHKGTATHSLRSDQATL